MPRICNYEGSRYRTDFWEGQQREYEDRVERLAIQKMLPPTGQRLIEIGAGFGRLADLYTGYDQVVLMDYARTQLEDAQRYLNDDGRFVYVVADVYSLPFADNLFDALTMVRVMHHLADVPAALVELQRVVAPGGAAVIEYASKFHLKALLRWLLRRQAWSPFDQAPLEFVDMNFDFHPAWMRRQFQAAGFSIQNIRTVSHFRLPLLKRLLPTAWLVALDSLAQLSGNWWQLTPSVFVQAGPVKSTVSAPTDLFRCPACHAANLSRHTSPADFPGGDLLVCPQCQRRWTFKDGIYDFKMPLAH